ncbi:MAG TPA: hypothetical protein VLQ45_21140 [Thermoanaerobaculia bacterium]|nr:hypothetical protein [Thermoanaerobaculia bacterium]
MAYDLTLRLPLLKERERKTNPDNPDKPEPLSFRRGVGVRSQATDVPEQQEKA